MRTLLKSDFFWQFMGGFALGALGLASVNAIDMHGTPGDHVETISHVQH